MPKLPRIKASEVIRVLEHLGFVQVRQRGSHVMNEEATGRRRRRTGSD
ncbi:type II toxin-antitoxin system HicA family toxin [Tolypothrix sp. VBCCA 56010]